ncbi:MAG TPA: hypothetical protein VMB21_17740 [Candidatus Limnocylindria bacterium]|jgi:hypothetical protein|nr:hypothetical protein [Candidatus Limnocylindria bacterium]
MTSPMESKKNAMPWQEKLANQIATDYDWSRFTADRKMVSPFRIGGL